MNFFEQQDRARRISGRLLILMVLAVASLIALTSLVLGAIWQLFGQNHSASLLDGSGSWLPSGPLVAMVAVAVIAVLMFAKFHSDDEAFTPQVINETVQAIEQIMKQFDVMKVKTIGSNVMAVCGIDDPRTRQEQLTAVVDAAIMIRACVFQQMNVPNLVHRIGIHCGPCFGAVIGGNGAIFDLFGDTVNTASRMMSNAANGGIQMSAASNGLLLPRLQTAVESRPPVAMKGKGLMQVYAVKEGVGVEDSELDRLTNL